MSVVRLPVVQNSRARERTILLSIDGEERSVPEGTTLLDACKTEIPILCYAKNLTPVNVCRLCVVEVEGARTLVPACSRKAEAGMVVHTKSTRVKLARRMVLELLASSVDITTAPEFARYMELYGANAERFGKNAATVADHTGDVKVDNDLYVRDYGKCILCYKCVEACGLDAQNTYAIALSGRGFLASISTEFAVPLPDSACVYCGNCIGVCPTGALMFKTEYEMRKEGTWDESKQRVTDTICPYCGVGCTLSLHVQDQRIVKVSSPADSEVTSGHLCIKGRFGWSFV